MFKSVCIYDDNMPAPKINQLSRVNPHEKYPFPKFPLAIFFFFISSQVWDEGNMSFELSDLVWKHQVVLLAKPHQQKGFSIPQFSRRKENVLWF